MSYRNLKSIGAMALVAAAALAIGATPAGATPAQQETPTRSITVPGLGVAYGAPDIAYLNLGVETANEDITAALNDASANMDAVLAALQAGGVAREDIRTTTYNVYQETPYPIPMAMPEGGEASEPGGAPAPVYHVSTYVEVTVRDTGEIGSLIAAAVEAGANAVNNVRFDLADRAALESEARLAALDDARARAQQIADALGLTLGDVIEVVEGGGLYPGPVAYGRGGGLEAASVPPISEGALSVSISLTVTFAVQ